MAVSKYVSDVKIIHQNIEIIFNYLSDFENISRYMNEDVIAAITAKVPQIKISNFSSDHDSCRFDINGMGSTEIKIVERTPFKTIKIEGQGGLPFEMKFWIQLLPLETYETKMRLTLHADMSIMIKMMVENKLEKGINSLADMLAMLPYQ